MGIRLRRVMPSRPRGHRMPLGNYTFFWKAASLTVFETIPTHRRHFAHLTSTNLLAKKKSNVFCLFRILILFSEGAKCCCWVSSLECLSASLVQDCRVRKHAVNHRASSNLLRPSGLYPRKLSNFQILKAF